MINTQPESSFDKASLAANIASEKKGSDITVLETTQVTSLSDFFVISSAESATQVRAIADAISDAFKQIGYAPIGQERDNKGQWYLLDYGDIIIHIMHQETRSYYELETFWNHASVIPETRWDDIHKQAS